jgi:hypothetical protein
LTRETEPKLDRRESPLPCWSGPDQRESRVDARDVARTAGDNGVFALPGTQGHVNVGNVVVPGLRTHQPYGARGVQCHNSDVDISGFQQPGQANLIGTAPRLAIVSTGTQMVPPRRMPT